MLFLTLITIAMKLTNNVKFLVKTIFMKDLLKLQCIGECLESVNLSYICK